VEGFLDVLAGDRAGLERMFIVDFRGSRGAPASGWELSLVPRDAALLSILREVDFAGRDLRVRQMRIREASGDESVTTFSDVDTARRYTPAEASRVFDVAPAAGATDGGAH
jgi:hypothetical protein